MISQHLTTLTLLLTPALAFGGEPKPEVPPKSEPTKTDNFTWADPFASPLLSQFTSRCEGRATFPALEFQLHDLSAPEPQGLEPYSEALKGAFVGRPYPGGWDGVDAHGYERELVRMEWAAVPARVRRWIAEQEEVGGAQGKGLFAVFEKPAEEGKLVKGTVDLDGGDVTEGEEERTVVFAPGAIYETLPLWVADGSGCEDELADLEKYSPSLVDGGVVGWLTEHSTPARGNGDRSIEFTIKAQVLSGQANASAQKDAQAPVDGDSKDEL